MEIELGAPITLECQVRGHPKQIIWMKDGEEISNERYKVDYTEEIAKLVVEESLPEDEGDYTIKVVNDKGVATSSAEEGDVAILEITDISLEDADVVYTCKAENLAGEQTCSAQLTAQAPALITESPEIVKAKEGETISITCKIEGHPAPTVTWAADGTVVPQDEHHLVEVTPDTVTLNIPHSTVEDTATYTLSVENPLGTDQKSVSVTVAGLEKAVQEDKPAGQAPEFVLKIKPQTIEEGETVDFSCEVRGEPKPELQWFLNGKPLQDEGRFMVFEENNVHHLEIYEIETTDQGEYTVQADNELGQATCTAQLQVLAKPVEEVKELEAPKFLIEIQTVEANIGETPKFTCKAVGKPMPEILWYKNDKEITKSDNRFKIEYTEEGESSLLVVDVLPEQDGTYTAEAKNEAGSVKCKAELFVEEPKDEKLAAPDFIKVPDKVVVREHGRAEFLVKVIGMPKPTVQWKKDDEILDDTELYHYEKYEDTYCFEIKDTEIEDGGVYTCVATNEVGETTCDIPLQVNAIDREKRLSESPLVLKHQESSQAPDFTRTIDDCTVMEDKSLTLSCVVTGLPRPEITWYRNGKEFVPTPNVSMSYDEETAILNIKKITMDQEGEFKCVAKNSAGEAECIAQVTVEGKTEAPVFTRKLNNRECKEGRPIKFECAAKGIPVPEITWFINEKPVEDSLRFRVDQRKTYTDLVHSLSIDNTEVEDAGEVKAIAKNKAGQAVTIAKLVVEEKKESPKFVKKLENKDVVEKNKLVLEVEVTGRPKPTVTWYQTDKLLEESEDIRFEVEDKTYRLIISPVKLTDACLYSAKAQNTAGQASCSCRVKVLPARRPSILRKMSDTLVPEEGATKFECKVEGFPLPEVKWYINDKEIEEGPDVHFEFNRRDSTYTLTIDKCSPEMQGLIKAVAVNQGGEELCTANLEVRGRAPSFKEMPIKCTILEGSTAIFRCLVDGSPEPEIQWSKGKWNKIKDGGRFKVYKDEKTGEDVLEIADIKKKDAGTYQVTATNEHGSEAAPATIIVTDNEDDVQDWLAQLQHREYEKSELEGEEEWMPKLKHVEMEESPEKKKFVPGTAELEEKSAYEILARRRRSEMEEFTPAKPKEKKPEEPKAEVKEEYVRELKAELTEETEELELVIPKAKWEIVKPLQDVNIKETEEAVFECELNLQNVDVIWKVNGKKIEQSPKYVIHRDKTKHRLEISKCRPSDEGEVSCTYASLTTQAKLTVQDATFTCTVNDDEAEVTWTFNGKPINESDKYHISSDEVTHSLTIKDVSAEDTGIVQATVGDQSTSAELTIAETGADFVVPLTDKTALEKSDVEFVCELSHEVDNVRWFLDDVELRPSDKVKLVTDGNQHKLLISNIEVEDEGQISAIVGDKKTTACLYVKELSPEITKPLSDATIMEGDMVEFTCEVSEEGATVKWFLDGKEINEDERYEILSDQAPTDFTAMLTEQHVEEHKACYFTCQVNKDDVTVTWYKHNQEIKPSDKHIIKDDGKSHTLIVMDAIKEDVAEYTVVVGDKKSAAKLHLDVSKADVRVDWFKDKVEIFPCEKYEINERGGAHVLTVRNLCMSDYGNYVVVIDRKPTSAEEPYTEIPLRITVPLKDKYDCVEGETVVLECEVNKPGIVAMWLKDGEQIMPMDEYEIQVDGCRHILKIPEATLDHEAEYTIMIGNQDSGTVLYVEEAPAEFTHRLSDIQGEEGQDFELECILSKPDVNVSWLKNRKPLTPTDRIKILCDRYRHVLRIMEAIPEDEGEYTCLLPDNTETSAFVKIKEVPPEFTKPLSDMTAKEKESVQMDCELNKPYLPVKWLKDGEDLTVTDRVNPVMDGYTQLLKFQDLTLEDGASYTCVFRDISTEGKLTVEELPPEFTKPLDDMTVKEKDTAKFECELTKPNIPVKWLKNGEEIKPDDHINIVMDSYIHQLVFTDITLADQAKYTCVCGNVSTEATLFVEELPAEFRKPLTDMTVKQKENVTLECEINKPNIPVKWFKDELPAEFRKPLTDMTVKEKENVTLECELNKPNIPVKWFKDGEEIKPDDHVKIVMDSYIHQLVFTEVTLADKAKYTCVCGDVSTEATLTVEELPVEFTKPLKDMKVKEKETVTLKCELNKPNRPVKWLKDGQEIKPDDRIKFVMDCYMHQIIITDVTLSDMGKITCVCGDVSTEATLTVEELPVEFTKPLKDMKVKEKETVTLKCELNKPNRPVKWLKNGQEIKPDDRIKFVMDCYMHQIIITDVTLSDMGKITCVCGDVSTEATLTVEELPVEFTKPLKDMKVKEKETVTLECELNKPNRPVKWLKDGQEIKPDDRIKFVMDCYMHQIIITDVTLSDMGKITCVCGDVSTTATLLVEELPVEFTKPLKDFEVMEHTTVSLECEINKPNEKSKWYKDDKEIDSAGRFATIVDGGQHILTISDVQLPDEAEYKCIVGKKSTKATMLVEEAPVEFISPVKEMTVTEKDTVCLECEISKPNVKAKWLKDGKEIKPDKGHHVIVDGTRHRLVLDAAELDDQAEYTIEVEGKHSAAKLTVEEAPVEFIRPLTDVQVMENEKVVMECEVNKPDLLAKWFIDDEELTGSEHIELVVYSTIHQMIIETAKLEDEGKYTIVVGEKKSTATLLVDELVTGLHDLYVPQKGTAVFECEVNIPNVKAKWYKDGEPITVSDGYDIRSDGTCHFLYLQKVSKEDMGEYTVVFDDLESSAYLKVKELPLKVTRPLLDAQITEKDSVTLTCEVSKPNVKAKWKKDGVEIEPSEHYDISTKDNVHTLKINNAVIEDGAVYTCQVEDKETVAKIVVKEEPLTVVKPLSDVEIKEGQTVTLECVASKPDAQVTWLKNGKPIPEDDEHTQIVVKDKVHQLIISDATLDDEADYSIKVGDKSSKAAIFVEEEPIDFVRKLEDIDVNEIPGEATFECEITKDNITAKWFKDGKPIQPGDKYKMVSEGTIHRLVVSDVDSEDEGDYMVVLRGKKSEAELVVEVAPELVLDKQFNEELTLNAGQSTAFEIPFKGNPQPKVVWTINNEDIPEDKRIEVETINNFTTMRLFKVKRSDQGDYTLTLENPAGKVSITIKLTVLDKPSPPVDLSVADVTAESVTLKWQPPEDDGGSEVTGYIIERREFNRRTWQKVDETTDLEYTIHKLLQGNQYYFHVIAKNAIGQSEPAELTEAVLAKIHLVIEPDTPSIPVVSDVRRNSATVTWQPPENDGGSPITCYHLEKRSGFSGRWVQATKDLIEGTTYTVTDLIEDNTYEFRVAAENKAGLSKPSEPSESFKAKDPWNDGGAPVTNYVIEYRMIGAFRWLQANEDVTILEPTYSVTGLKEGSDCEFRVSAENKAGVGQPSQPTRPVKVEAPIVGEAPKLLEELLDTTVVAPKDAILECDLERGEPEAEITW
ncbi:hypothetical protein KUTeg_001478 [Tegillarca granosa]|uniref:Uncharacterized protein n=1 Tax=Tegillarca granosa TaxID=220873 RepID=A0ABQ9FT19_TEGGR|nr:hypothetical protein KUTeg_001478 [Tegillarca granosa]